MLGFQQLTWIYPHWEDNNESCIKVFMFTVVLMAGAVVQR